MIELLLWAWGISTALTLAGLLAFRRSEPAWLTPPALRVWARTVALCLVPGLQWFLLLVLLVGISDNRRIRAILKRGDD